MTAHPTPEKILQVGLGFWPSKTLLSAVEMEVFTELAKHPEDLNSLQGRLGLHPRSARDFFDALVALGFLNRIDGKYHNTPETDLFLDKRKPTYVGGILDMANSRLFGFWNHLTEGLRTGSPQNEAKEGGESLFAALYASPARLKEFLAAMTGLSHGANLAIDTSDPDWVQAVLDSTGGKGVDLIVDQVSGGLVTPNMRAARILGRIVNVGRLGGQKTEFDADLHALRRITYIGVTFRTRTPQEVAEITRALLADLTPALEAGRFRMPIDSVFPLEDFAQALAKMRANEHFGKIVLRH